MAMKTEVDFIFFAIRDEFRSHSYCGLIGSDQFNPQGLSVAKDCVDLVFCKVVGEGHHVGEYVDSTVVELLTHFLKTGHGSGNPPVAQVLSHFLKFRGVQWSSATARKVPRLHH